MRLSSRKSLSVSLIVLSAIVPASSLTPPTELECSRNLTSVCGSTSAGSVATCCPSGSFCQQPTTGTFTCCNPAVDGAATCGGTDFCALGLCPCETDPKCNTVTSTSSSQGPSTSTTTTTPPSPPPTTTIITTTSSSPTPTGTTSSSSIISSSSTPSSPPPTTLTTSTDSTTSPPTTTSTTTSSTLSSEQSTSTTESSTSSQSSIVQSSPTQIVVGGSTITSYTIVNPTDQPSGSSRGPPASTSVEGGTQPNAAAKSLGGEGKSLLLGIGMILGAMV